MSLSDISLTKYDFAQSHWEDVISGCEERECQNYSRQFFAKAREAKESGDAKAQQVFTLLGAITSLILKSDCDEEPFAPMAVFQNSRSAILDDISDEYLDVLREVVPEISDAEMRARVADILWTRKRDFRMAQLAVTSYLESAQNLEDPKQWTACFYRVERAINLAACLGKKNHPFASVVAHIEAVLDRYNGEDSLFLSAKLMELLQQHGIGDTVKYAALAEKAAVRAESEHAWYRARDYWQIKARWHTLQKDSDSERAALLSAAETYVKESEDTLNLTSTSYLAASSHIEKAIEALRRIGGTKERVEELHKVLIEYQQKYITEMNPVFTEKYNLSECVEKAKEEVKGKALHDALLTLAGMVESPKVDTLRTLVQESTGKYVFQHLISQTIVNNMGKVVARKSSMFSNDSQEVEKATREEMFKWARLKQQIYAQAVVEPAKYQINLEHNVRLDDWLPIVSNNPLIPLNREYTYARGLHAGLKGDFLVAAHLLIPQLENSVRYILNQNGFITSKLDEEGIQDEKDLNTLLYSEQAKTIFNENILFDLQGLLINRFGSNLRNRMAHGLMDYNEFYSLQMSYLWWLTLHLCCWPIFAKIHSQSEQSEASEDNEGSAGKR